MRTKVMFQRIALIKKSNEFPGKRPRPTEPKPGTISIRHWDIMPG